MSDKPKKRSSFPEPPGACRRRVPDEFVTDSGIGPRCDQISSIDIRHTIVGYSLSTNGTPCTDSEIRLRIAEIERAIEMSTAHARQVIELLELLLKPEAKCLENRT